MKIQNLFYVLGIIFIFITVFYFTYQYIFDLSNPIKTVILILFTIITFFVADYLREKDK